LLFGCCFFGGLSASLSAAFFSSLSSCLNLFVNLWLGDGNDWGLWVCNQGGVLWQNNVCSGNNGAVFEALEGNFDLFWNVQNVSFNQQNVGISDEHQTRCWLTNEGQWNFNFNLLAALNGQQVEVVHVQGKNVLLDALNHGQVLIAVDLELQISVGAVVTDQGVQLQDVSCEVDWLGVGTVDNTWNQVCATQTTCGTLAEFVTCLSFNYRTLCHVFLLQENCRKYLFQVNSVGRRALAKRKNLPMNRVKVESSQVSAYSSRR